MEATREPNPSLGRRGIRFLQQFPELLQTQLDAVLRLSLEFDLHILVPMVTLKDDEVDDWIKRSIREAISIARTIDASVQSDDELPATDAEGI